MIIVNLYLVLLFLIGELLYRSYAMTEKPDRPQSSRSDRQLRPILNGIIFLLAANLVAKGTLALGGYQAQSAIPNNLQGSLYLTLNQPQSGNCNPCVPAWFPMPYAPGATERPIHQQQIVSLGEPLYEEAQENYPGQKNGLLLQKLIINRFGNIDEIIPSASEEKKIRVLPDTPQNSSLETEGTTEDYIDDDVEILDSTTVDSFGRQAPATTTSSTTTTLATTTAPTTTTRRATTVPSRPPAMTPAGNTPTTPPASNISHTNNTTTTEKGYYGQSGLNDTISITNPPPIQNQTGIANQNLQPPKNTNNNKTNNENNNNTLAYGPPAIYAPPTMYGPASMYDAPNYHYPPSGNYGPSNGNENISITYGAPNNNNNNFYQQQQPFFSSPEDPYLNNFNQYYYNNNPGVQNTFYPQTQFNKYGDFFNKFYSTNYPAFYNNYLGK